MTLTTSAFVLVFAAADLVARKRHTLGRPAPAVVCTVHPEMKGALVVE